MTFGLTPSENLRNCRKKFRNELLGRVARIGLEVEKALGGVPQDIEGVHARGEYHVVQTRPQV